MFHRKEAKRYLKNKRHFREALRNKSNRYHKEAIMKLFSKPGKFMKALKDSKSPYHEAAVHEYLLFGPIRADVLSDAKSKYYVMAKKIQEKIEKLHADGHHHANGGHGRHSKHLDIAASAVSHITSTVNSTVSGKV
jgi:hypothetical protein